MSSAAQVLCSKPALDQSRRKLILSGPDLPQLYGPQQAGLRSWRMPRLQVVRAVAAKDESQEAMKASLRARLAEIEKEINNASEQRYLEGLAHASSPGALAAPLSSPIFEPSHDDLPSPARDEESGEIIERTWHARADLEGVSAEGSGREVLLQAFNWESHRQNWWQHVAGQAQRFADFGFTVIWLPPPTASVAPQGYMPTDLYNLNSAYGSEEDLRRCIATLQQAGLKVLCDAILNHRCASAQDEHGIWNKFGGKLDWDSRAIVGDDRNFGGRGGASSGEIFHAAPNIDHAQQFVKADVAEWMQWLRDYIGYDGWRFDYVKGFSGEHVADYVAATSPEFVVGEFWDSLAYDGSVPNHNQDAHRQRTVNWLNSARGGATAFDVTSKGILHAVFERTEFDRLRDAKGKPPGLLGWWPSRCVTFLENHDTGSTQGHWRFPSRNLEEGYAYIMTHPGTPSVFLDHLDDGKLADVIKRLIALRKQADIHCRSKVQILEAAKEVYAAVIDERLLMAIGPGNFSADNPWELADSGKRWKVWLKK